MTIVEARTADGRGTKRTIRLLLVEDNPGDVRLMREILSRIADAAFDILHAPTLRRAIEILEEEPVEIVLLDLGLPDSLGLETLERIRKGAARVPIIVLTGLQDDEIAVKSVHARAQDFLTKGEVEPALLLRRIRQAIESQRLQSEMAGVIQALRDTSARSRELITANADGILVMDRGGRILFANPAACALVGVEAAQLIGRVIDEPLTDADTIELEFQVDQVVELRITETSWEGAPALLAALRDITAHRTAELALKKLNNRLQTTNSRLQQLAFADPLTELLNRRGLEHMLQSETSRARRRGAPMVACLVDCDDFKAINDQHGHVVGDAVLRELSRRLAKGLRLSDHLARVGGDEFLVLLPETRLVEGMQIASRLRAAASDEPIRHGDATLPLTVSMGVAEVSGGSGTVQEILAATQSALHHSKAHGKNQVTGPSPDDAADPMAEDVGLRGLLEEGSLRVVFQRILGLPGEDLRGYEALSRGPHGRWEMPDQFFTLGSTTEKRTAIDLRCAENCLRAVEQMPAGNSGRVHINLFPTTILSAPLDHLLERMLEVRGNARICIEISEQHVTSEALRMRDRLKDFRAEGIEIALDDVGAGNSILETLLHLEPDVIKIDKTCIQDTSRDPDKRAFLGRLMKVAQALDGEVIAEGIESREDLVVVNDMGIRFGQGFLWGRPAALGSAVTRT